MRGAGIRGIGGLALAALAAAGVGLGPGDDLLRREADPSPRRRARPVRSRPYRGFLPAGVNRHTGKPHEHSREKARRARQAERAAERQRERAYDRYGLVEHFGISRRGRKVGV